MRSYKRPKEKYLYVEKRRVEAKCPKCGGIDIRKYPVLSEGGWWQVTKCQDCLFSLERKRSLNRLGQIELLSDLL